MSDRWIYEGVSVLGLAVSAIAVCDMLLVWNMAWLESAFTIYAIALLAAVALVTVIKRTNAAFTEACRRKPRLLALRLVLALALFLLGWYVNAAMTKLYGAESAQVAYNAARMLAVIATLLGHVFYFGFAQKAQKR